MTGVCLGGGVVSTDAYKRVVDGPIAFNKDGWEAFMEENDLTVGRAVLIMIRNCALDELVRVIFMMPFGFLYLTFDLLSVRVYMMALASRIQIIQSCYF